MSTAPRTWGNTNQGIELRTSSGGELITNNTIGGTALGAGNVISGNRRNRGIEIRDAGTNGNIVEGNKIGTDPAGTGGFPNNIGVSVFNGASNNRIGGTAANAGNIIAFNLDDGIHS